MTIFTWIWRFNICYWRIFIRIRWSYIRLLWCVSRNLRYIRCCCLCWILRIIIVRSLWRIWNWLPVFINWYNVSVWLISYINSFVFISFIFWHYCNICMIALDNRNFVLSIVSRITILFRNGLLYRIFWCNTIWTMEINCSCMAYWCRITVFYINHRRVFSWIGWRYCLLLWSITVNVRYLFIWRYLRWILRISFILLWRAVWNLIPIFINGYNIPIWHIVNGYGFILVSLVFWYCCNICMLAVYAWN